MRNSRMRAIVGAVGAAAAFVATASPADASITGALGFQCTVTIGFPAGSGTGSCSGVAVGVGAGVDTAGHAYVIAGPANFNAGFSYAEDCPVVAPVPPPIGTASGTATANGLLLTYVHSGSPTTGPGTVTTQFEWIRVGTVAVIITHDTQVFAGHTAVSASPISGTADDVAVAAFVPIGPAGNCSAPAATTAAVVGVDVIPI